jgi:peptide-methionine (S)-S-oxide reductase
MFFRRIPEQKLRLPTADEALPGRETPIPTASTHRVLGTPLQPPFPAGMQQIIFGLGCFWGAERLYWKLPGVYTTAAGYCAGLTPNPTYEEVCSGQTGHNEVVLVVFDPARISLDVLLKTFWEAHDPTQGMRQGNDMGTQYRSGIYCSDEQQLAMAESSRERFAAALDAAGRATITTEIQLSGAFYYAEDYHQQYLDRVPNGYCGLAGTGVCLPPASASAPA